MKRLLFGTFAIIMISITVLASGAGLTPTNIFSRNIANGLYCKLTGCNISNYLNVSGEVNATIFNGGWNNSIFYLGIDDQRYNDSNISIRNGTDANLLKVNFSEINTTYIESSDWSNITITENQIIDLVHTTDTNASTACSSGEVLGGGGDGCISNATLGIVYNQNNTVHNITELYVDNNITIGIDTDLRWFGVNTDGHFEWTNSSQDQICNLTDTGRFECVGDICSVDGCIGDVTDSNASTICNDDEVLKGDGTCENKTTGRFYMLTCGENQALDSGVAEWSCGGNGEVSQYMPIFVNSTLKHIGLYCNTVIGEANITIQKYSGIDTACDLNGTAPYIAECDVDVDAGEWIRPYTVHDSGHAYCVLSIGLETR